MTEIGFGGSCHWCTEAIFLSLKGVNEVRQGWIAPDTDDAIFSEAVVVLFDETIISAETLVAVHLNTHSCTSNHSMRLKYRSAVYAFTDEQAQRASNAIKQLQGEFTKPILTMVLPFKDFRLNTEDYLNYYYNNPDKPFCENIVNPKLRLLMHQFANKVDADKLKHLH